MSIHLANDCATSNYSSWDVLFLFTGALKPTYLGVIMAHAVLGTPFVIITVTATLVGFDKSLVEHRNRLGQAR